MFQTVVVPLDGSKFGEFALPWAMSIARRSGATLRLVRVAPPLGDAYFWAPLPGSSVEAELKEHLHADAMAYLDGVAVRLRNAGAGRIACAVIDGEVSEAIKKDCANSHTDMLVMTSHGRGQVERIWLGSVADELIRSLTIPVLLVRPDEKQNDIDLTEPPLRHILLAVDGTPLAERTVSPALAVGKLTNADYTLVRIIAAGWSSNHPHGTTEHTKLPPTLSAEMGKIKDRVFLEANSYLEHLAEQLRVDGVQVQTQVLSAAQPAAGILQEAAAIGADLIALESHGRHGLSRLLMGSVTDKVVRGSTHPVLVCRA